MKKQYPYLNDTQFLSKIDSLQIQEQWVKITLLEYSSEVPLDEIEGEVVGGTLSKDGSSAVRRTCSLNCNIDAFTYDPDDVKSKYSISKKIFLELGITNTTDEYTDNSIIWFPQGIFFISSFSISASSSGAASIQAQFKDKMAQLDGTIGGILPATVRFDLITTVVDGVVIDKKALVYDIIMETVNHFGGEAVENIIIDDIPEKAKRLIRWNGSEPVWIYPIQNASTGEISYDICFDSDIDEKQSAHTPIESGGGVLSAQKYTNGEDIGYMYEDFVYDEELTFAAGSKVTDVLDKVKAWLGNYEYFYDEFGQFHFQEIKNYLNNSESSYIWDKLESTGDLDYAHESTPGKTVYAFDDEHNIVSITNTPVYENIKNDYIVEGITTTNSGIKYTCRYHLVIDDKPSINTNGYDNTLLYKDPLSGNYTITEPIIINPELRQMIVDGKTVNEGYVWSLPEFADDGNVYALLDEPQVFTLKKQIKNLDHFKVYYDELVENEAMAIGKDNRYTAVTNTDETQQYLIALLEDYMSYTDTTAWKDEYINTIFTLTRQILRWDIRPQDPRDTSKAYYSALYDKYALEKGAINEGEVNNKVNQIGGLLTHLRTIFNGDAISTSSKRPDPNYVDTSYWPAVNVANINLWDGMEISTDKIILRKNRIAWCKTEIEKIKIKQKSLDVLIDQYGQIYSNYDALIKPYQRKKDAGTSTETDDAIYDELFAQRKNVGLLIDAFKEELDWCGKRITTLYAILTSLGASDENVGASYVEIDVAAPAYVSSFWYYDSDDSKDSYGWNELEWIKYYHSHEDAPTDEEGNPLNYYYNGLGSMTYIDFNSIQLWDDFDYSLHPIIDEDRGVSFSTDENGNGYLNIDNDFFRIDSKSSDTIIVGDAISRATNEQPVGFTDKRSSPIHYYWQFSDTYPSMNRYSHWYNMFYKDYAAENDLPIFSDDDVDGYIPKDWRVELINRGLQAQANGTDPGYYFAELYANWPMVYDFEKDRLRPNSIVPVDYFVRTTGVVLSDENEYYFDDTGTFIANTDKASLIDSKDLVEIDDWYLNYNNTNYYYFFDMIDSSSLRWGGYSVGNIGRRTNVTLSDSVNCIFSPDTPNYAFLNTSGMNQKARAAAITELQGIAENIIQVTDDFYNSFATGGLRQSAYDQIRYDLVQHTSYQNTVSLTVIPCFYLEPNTRIYMDDKSTGTNGDYVIKTISIPLGAGNNMSVSMSKAMEQI